MGQCNERQGRVQAPRAHRRCRNLCCLAILAACVQSDLPGEPRRVDGFAMTDTRRLAATCSFCDKERRRGRDGRTCQAQWLWRELLRMGQEHTAGEALAMGHVRGLLQTKPSLRLPSLARCASNGAALRAFHLMSRRPLQCPRPTPQAARTGSW